MADENIISSPRKLNCSIHRTRLHRKNKRLTATFTKTPEPPPTNPTTSSRNQNTVDEKDLSRTLLVMYDSEEDNIKEESLSTKKSVPNVNQNYDPFAEQRLLVLADRFAAPSRCSTNFEATQGFQPSNNFLNKFSEMCPEKNNVFHSIKKEEVEITDSELLQVCFETERSSSRSGVNIKQESLEVDQPTNIPTTPECQQKPKSIVDLILEDFCSSPASPDLKQSSEESNFHFRFANKPLRTYSRRKNSTTSARQNIAVQYEGAESSSANCRTDDDLRSNGSSTDLSVQEDQTQIEFITDVDDVVELQHSQSLCENLQNLSAYFTELSGEDRKEEKTLPDKQEQLSYSKCEGLARITDDQSSSIYYTAINQKKSSLEENEDLVVVKTPLHCPTRKCDNFSNEEEDNLKVKGEEIILTETPLQYASNLNGHISNEEDFIGFGSEEEREDDGVVNETFSNQNCDKLILHEDDASSLTDKDDWYDECDIFANLDMDAALDVTTSYKVDKEELCAVNHIESLKSSKLAQLNVEPMLGFRTASNKEVKISAEAQVRASTILQDLPPFNGSYIADQDMEAAEKEDCPKNLNQTFTITKLDDEHDQNSPQKQQQEQQQKYPNQLRNLDELSSYCYQPEAKEIPTFVGFTTASHKRITISKEAETKAAKILEQLPPLAPNEEENIANGSTENRDLKKGAVFKGFRTASSKEIKISKEAQERALKLLEQIPDLESDEEHVMYNMQGFCTASRKTIQISEEARKRAALIMEEVMHLKVDNVEHNVKECFDNIQFSEWPVEEEIQGVQGKIDAKSSDMKTGSNETLPGFATASNKAIKISETAKQKAAALLENLPELLTDEEIKCQNNKNSLDTESVQNVVFSEWPLDEFVAGEVNEQELPPNITHKRKRNDSNCAAIDDETARAHSPQTPKFICISPSKQRSPLADIQTAVPRSSLSELAIKTPPDYRSCRGVISRKNLLSLNKRNKLKAKSLQPSNEFKDDCSAVATPTNSKRRSTTPIATDIKSPPGTPIPNLQEFFQSATMSTSTPHPPEREQPQVRTRARKRAELQAAALSSSTKDDSFKRIEWENESLNKTAASLSVSRLSNASFSNITKMELNPTPKQRIERLRMYGVPPSVSPIPTCSTNNCRISGLNRRTRGANKVEQVNKE